MNPQDLQTAQTSMAPIFYSPSEVKPDIPAATPGQTGLPKSPSSPLDWLEQNASTIGGIVGGIGGEIIDPFGGGVVGSTIGSGVGQGIQNATTGSSDNVVGAAMTGGASQLIGGGITKLLGKGADVIGNFLSKGGGDYLRSQASGLSDRLATKLPQIFNNMQRYGVNKINNFEDFTNPVLSALDNGKNAALEELGPTVDASNLNQTVKNILNTNSLKKTDKETLSNLFDEEQGKMAASGRRGTLLNVPASQAYESAGVFGDKASAALGGKSPVNVTDFNAKNMYNAALQIKNAIRGRVDDVAMQGSVSQSVKDQVLAELKSSGKLNPALEEDVNNVKTYGDLTSLEANMLDAQGVARQTATSTTKGLMSKLGTESGVARNLELGAAVATGNPLFAAPAVLNTNTAKSVIGSAAQKAGAKLTTAAGKESPNIVGNLTRSAIPITVASQVMGKPLLGQPGATPPTLPGNQGGSVSNLVNDSVDSTMAPLLAAKNGTSTTGNVPALADILQAGGIEGLNAYLSYQRQEAPQLTEGQQKDWMDAQNAMNDVKSFAKVYEQSAAQGAGVGQLEMMGANIPGIQNLPSEAAIKAYEDNKGDLASSLSQILGGGKGSKALLEELKSELPDITDSPQTAAIKLHSIVQRLGQHMNTVLAAPATNTPGQLANFSGMTVPGTVNFNSPSFNSSTGF